MNMIHVWWWDVHVKTEDNTQVAPWSSNLRHFPPAPSMCQKGRPSWFDFESQSKKKQQRLGETGVCGPACGEREGPVERPKPFPRGAQGKSGGTPVTYIQTIW